MSREEFASGRRDILDRAEADLIGTVRDALATKQWGALISQALAVARAVAVDEGADGDLAAAVLDSLREVLSDALDKTGVGNVTVIARMVAVAAVNAGTAAAASLDEADLLLEWVTMHDGRVRESHRVADGQTIPVGDTFDVDGYHPHYPGEPVGPPDVWIGCRCVCRATNGEDMAKTAVTMAVEDPQPTEVTPTEVTPDEVVDEQDPTDGENLQWHGVLTIEGAPTGDNRMFEVGSISYRDLPLPLRWQKVDMHGHDGSVVVARIDNIWLEDGAHKASGVFAHTPEADEVIALIAEGMLRGVSVDLDDTTFEVRDSSGKVIADDDDEEGQMMVVTSGRIASASIVSIPAFQEGFIALGPWDEEPVVASVEEFAPGTHDGPGWITNPRATSRIRRYWTHGEGAAKIRWGQPGDFYRCRRNLAKYVQNPDWLSGLCFTGDTEFITADGLMTFADAVGTTQRILTAPSPTGQKGSDGQPKIGYWREAPIESFGEHEVMTVRLRRAHQVKEIRATRDHIWFATPGRNGIGNQAIREVSTENLRPGMVLASLMPQPLAKRGRSALSPFGVAAGMVFGDGTAAKDGTGASIDLWGDKDANLLPYFWDSRIAHKVNENGLDGVRVRGLPASWKKVPSLDEGFSYLYGWLAGYFAADGSVTDRGAATLSSASRENLEQASVIASRLGIQALPIGMQMRVGKGKEATPLYKMGFVGDTLPEEFFLIPKHRDKFASAPHSKSRVRWTVEEVVETGEVEEVFCAVVPDTENFALTDTIWVHNCANMHKEALGIWPGEHDGNAKAASAFEIADCTDCLDSLVAGGRTLPSSTWFVDPDLDGPTPVTVTEDGRVYGHVATWNVCHIGIKGICTVAPQSASGYAYYRTGAVLTDDGEVAVGHITLGTGHAGLDASATAAMAHYDNTGTVVADVAAGEDDHGIWIAGAMRPSATEDDVYALRAAALSGDWRSIGGHLEMVAALAVNVPGFPIPRTTLAASGSEQVAIIAAGVVQRRTEPIHDLVRLAVVDVLTEMASAKERAAALASTRSRLAAAMRGDLRLRLES